MCALSNSLALKPSGAGKLRMAMGSSRAMSALACAMRDAGLEPCQGVVAEVPELGLVAVPLERQEQRRIVRIVQKLKSLAATRR